MGAKGSHCQSSQHPDWQGYTGEHPGQFIEVEGGVFIHTGLPFPPQTQIGVHPDEGDEDQVNKHEGQSAFGMVVHRRVSPCYAPLAVCRNARKQSIAVTTPTRVAWSTTGRQPMRRCTSRRAACAISASGPMHTTSWVMHILTEVVSI